MPPVKANKDAGFAPASRREHVLVLAEDVDAGYEEKNRFDKPEHKGILVFQTDERIEEGERAGERKEVWFHYNVLSGLGSGPDYPTHLRLLLEGWRGKPFSPEELHRLEDEKYDPATLIGRCLIASVAHKVSKTSGRTYAYIVVDTVRACPKDRAIKVDGYTPYAEKMASQTDFPGPGDAQGSGAGGEAGEAPEDDDFPI